MFLFLLLQTSFVLDLAEFDSFQIDFNDACSEYLTLLGDTDYMSLSRNGDFITLFIGRGESHTLLRTEWVHNFIFGWPEMEINGNSMTPGKSFGEFGLPITFNISSLQCNIDGLRAGSLNMVPTDLPSTYKCENLSKWKVYLPSTLTALFSLLLIVCGYKTAHTTIAQYLQRLSLERSI